MQKIVPHLWFDKEAREASEFYVSLLPNSKITNISTIHDTPSGDCDMVSFTLADQEFMAISAGPYFKINPSISFMVNFDPSQDPTARDRIDTMWEKLLEGGQILMPLDKYPFSERYGWIQDRFGVSWQLIFTRPEGEPRPVIMPSFLFVQEAAGKAKEATEYYLTVFKDAPHAAGETRRGQLATYPASTEPNKEGDVMFTDIALAGQWFVAMDSRLNHQFNFNEAISLIVRCDNQEEIDYFWEKLSAVPEAEQCGWLKDKFGVSWQITPREMDVMLSKGTPEQVARVTKAFLQMKKFDIAALREAYSA